MYKEIATLKNISDYPIQFKNDLFYLTTRTDKNIYAYDINSLELKWQSDKDDYKCILVGETLAANNYSIYDLDGNQLYYNDNELLSSLHLTNNSNQGLYFTVHKRNGRDIGLYTLFDIRSLSSIKTDFEMDNWPLAFYDEKTIIGKSQSPNNNNFNQIELFDIIEEKIVWRINMNDIYSNRDVKIYGVAIYYNDVIVNTNAGALRLSAKDGKIIWKTKRYARTNEIADNVGYICSGLSLYKIDLNTGKESGYNLEYDSLPDIMYNGKSYWPSGDKVVYHNGLLWYSVYVSGFSFITAINPENGNFKWIHKVDTYSKTEPPQFYRNKMFILDTNDVLHIFEEEKL